MIKWRASETKSARMSVGLRQGGIVRMLWSSLTLEREREERKVDRRRDRERGDTETKTKIERERGERVSE